MIYDELSSESSFSTYINKVVETSLKVGEGNEKQVYKDPTNSEHVLSIFIENNPKYTPQFRKGTFYLTKVLHLLFPKNIPNVHLVSTKPNTNKADFVNGTSLAEITDSKKTPLQAKKKDLMEGLRQLGIPFFDFHSANLLVDKNDNLVFVDSFRPWITQGDHRNGNKRVSRLYNVEKLKQAINDKLSPEQKIEAEKYINRLEQLLDEEKK